MGKRRREGNLLSDSVLQLHFEWFSDSAWTRTPSLRPYIFPHDLCSHLLVRVCGEPFVLLAPRCRINHLTCQHWHVQSWVHRPNYRPVLLGLRLRRELLSSPPPSSSLGVESWSTWNIATVSGASIICQRFVHSGIVLFLWRNFLYPHILLRDIWFFTVNEHCLTDHGSVKCTKRFWFLTGSNIQASSVIVVIVPYCHFWKNYCRNQLCKF